MEQLVRRLIFKKQVHQGASSTRKKGEEPQMRSPKPPPRPKKKSVGNKKVQNQEGACWVMHPL